MSDDLKQNQNVPLELVQQQPKPGSQFANPACVGLFGFGLTTVLLNIHNAGFYDLDVLILAMGLAYGGSAQFCAGLLEFAKGNTFGFTAFTSYGAFWLSFAALKLLPLSSWFAGAMPGADSHFMGFYLIMWGIFTAIMFVGTLKKNIGLQVIFGSLTLLFVLLAIGDWTGSATVTKVAGWEGIFCGLSAVYVGCAEIWHDSYGYKVIPY